MRTFIALLEGAIRYLGWWLQAVTAWRDPRAPLGPRRLLVLLAGVPLFFVVQAVHGICLLLDEVLYPGYRQQPVGRALFITGIPRSATTFVHRTLAADTARFRTPGAWEVAVAPAICQRRLIRRLGRLDARLGGYGQRALAGALRRLAGGLDAIHPVELDAPEEDYLALLPAGGCFIALLAFPAAAGLQGLSCFPERLSAGRQQRLLACYERCLQRQLYDGAPGTVLLSKNAALGSWTPALYERFPQARFLICLREPRSALSSQVSSVGAARALGVAVDRPAFQRLLLDAYAGSLAHLAELAERDTRSRVAVVDTGDLRVAPERVLGAALERLGEPVDGRLARALAEAGRTGAGSSSPHRHDPSALAWAEPAIEARLQPPYRHLLASAHRVGGPGDG